MARQGQLLAEEWPDPPVTAAKPAGPEDLFAAQCLRYRLPHVERHYPFARSLRRRWEVDFAFVSYRLIVEIEGLAVERRCTRCYGDELIIRGRHGSVQGMTRDMEKYNTAEAVFFWHVLRFPPNQVRSQQAIQFTMRALAARGWKGPGT